MMEGTGSVQTWKSARMIKRGWRTIAHETSAQDQKYSPRRRLKVKNRDAFTSSPSHQEIPMKAAIVVDMGRSCLMSFMLGDR